MDSFFTCLLLLSLPVFCTGDIRLPPSISIYEKTTFYFQTDTRVTLPCEAHGVPPPTISWDRNHTPVQSNTLDGSLVIEAASSASEGRYICTASNAYGIAQSAEFTLIRTTVGGRDPNSTVGLHTGQVGKATALECSGIIGMSPESVVSFKWTYEGSQPVMSDDRIKIAGEKLYFAHLLMNDTGTYKCSAYNREADVTIGGVEITLNVDNQMTPGYFKPRVMHSTDRKQVAYAGEELELQCFFQGYPTPTVSWLKNDKELELGDKYVYDNYNSSLIIKSVGMSDAGIYKCLGYNGIVARVTRELHVTVIEKLHFASESDKPVNLNATEGENVTVWCRPLGNPPADSVELKIIMEKVPDGEETLSLINVQKYGDNGTSDLMIVQCIAENKWSTVFAQGYVNVLKRTVIKELKIENQSGVSGKAVIQCIAESDEATPVGYDWLFNGENIISSRVYERSGGTLHIDLKSAEEDESSHLGKYTCIASNGYSEAREDLAMKHEAAATLQSIGSADLILFFLVFVCPLLIFTLVMLWKAKH